MQVVTTLSTDSCCSKTTICNNCKTNQI